MSRKTIVGLCITLLIIAGVGIGLTRSRMSTQSGALVSQDDAQTAVSVSDDSIVASLMSSNFALPNYGGKMFMSFEKLGRNSSLTQTTEYVWAVFQEYYVKNGILEKGTGTSLPVVLYFENGKFVALNVPRSGSAYYDDIQRIFPDSIKQLPIFVDIAKHNESVAVLQSHARADAEEYFASSITPVYVPPVEVFDEAAGTSSSSVQ